MQQQPRPLKELMILAASASHGEAFERAVSQNRARIHRFLLSSSRDPELAEALTQECFLKAYRNWSRSRGEAQVSTWLLSIAINLQKEYRRNQRMKFWRRTRDNSLPVNAILQYVPISEDSPERNAAAKQQVAMIWKLVAGFSEKERTVFLLRVVEEMTLTEIAGATGMRPRTVRATFNHSMNKLRGAFRAAG